MFRTRTHTQPEYFNPKSQPNFVRHVDIGQRADRPFMILATIADLSLGDFLCKVAFVSSLKDQFDHARLFVGYNNFRPFSADVIALSPNIDHAQPINGELPRWLRPFIRDLRLWRPLGSTLTRSGSRQEAFYDMVVVDSMMASHKVHTFDPPTRLRIPEQLHDNLTAQLSESGLDMAAPFVVMHYRDGTYAPKSKNPVRNGDPENYRQAADHIIDELGCQVVRIGHPEMKPFPPRDGYIDISRHKHSFMLQAFAVSKARFMLAGASGPVALGWGLGTPTAAVDCCAATIPWGSAENVVLTQELTTPDGEKLQNQSFYDSGLFDINLVTKALRENTGYALRRNTAEELCAIASHLFERTHASVVRCSQDIRDGRRPRPNAISWPPRISGKLKFFDPFSVHRHAGPVAQPASNGPGIRDEPRSDDAKS